MNLYEEEDNDDSQKIFKPIQDGIAIELVLFLFINFQKKRNVFFK